MRNPTFIEDIEWVIDLKSREPTRFLSTGIKPIFNHFRSKIDNTTRDVFVSIVLGALRYQFYKTGEYTATIINLVIWDCYSSKRLWLYWTVYLGTRCKHARLRLFTDIDWHCDKCISPSTSCPEIRPVIDSVDSSYPQVFILDVTNLSNVTQEKTGTFLETAENVIMKIK